MIDLTITGASELEDRFRQGGPRLQQLLTREMTRLVLLGQSKTVGEKLQGQVLHHRTGNLQRAVATDVSETSNEVVGTWGVSRLAPYGKIHEYGGTVTIPEHIRTSKLGKSFPVRSHTATYPERSFLRSVLHEMEPTIRERLAVAALEALQG